MIEVTEDDMDANKLESILGEWASEFGRKIADKYCIRSPRYSEMRS